MSRRLAFPDRVTPHKWSQSRVGGKKQNHFLTDVSARLSGLHVNKSIALKTNKKKGFGEKTNRELRRTLTKCKTGIL